MYPAPPQPSSSLAQQHFQQQPNVQPQMMRPGTSMSMNAQPSMQHVQQPQMGHPYPGLMSGQTISRPGTAADQAAHLAQAQQRQMSQQPHSPNRPPSRPPTAASNHGMMPSTPTSAGPGMQNHHMANATPGARSATPSQSLGPRNSLGGMPWMGGQGLTGANNLSGIGGMNMNPAGMNASPMKFPAAAATQFGGQIGGLSNMNGIAGMNAGMNNMSAMGLGNMAGMNPSQINQLGGVNLNGLAGMNNVNLASLTGMNGVGGFGGMGGLNSMPSTQGVNMMPPPGLSRSTSMQSLSDSGPNAQPHHSPQQMHSPALPMQQSQLQTQQALSQMHQHTTAGTSPGFPNVARSSTPLSNMGERSQTPSRLSNPQIPLAGVPNGSNSLLGMGSAGAIGGLSGIGNMGMMPNLAPVNPSVSTSPVQQINALQDRTSVGPSTPGIGQQSHGLTGMPGLTTPLTAPASVMNPALLTVAGPDVASTPPRAQTESERGSVPPGSVPMPASLGIHPGPVGTPARPSATPASITAPSTPAANLAVSSTSKAASGSVSVQPGPPPMKGPQLNMSMTRVTYVPLAESKTLIPDLTPEEIANVKKWIEVDQEYEKRFREMRERLTKGELQEFVLGGPAGRRPRWWEKDPETEAAIALRRKKEKFTVIYESLRESSSQNRKKQRKREGLKIPGRLKESEVKRGEQLVPIRLEFDVEHYKYRDTFVWNLNDPIVTPEAFAQSIIDDYGLSSTYHSIITKSIQEQLSDYKAHTASIVEIDEDEFNTNENGIIHILEGEHPPIRGSLKEEDCEWWKIWRQGLRNGKGFVRTGKFLKILRDGYGRSKKRRKSAGANGLATSDKEDFNEVEMYDFDEDKMTEEMRILIKLDITVGSMRLDDQFEWDIENPDACPEQFAEIYGTDLGLTGEFKTAVAHSIREQVAAYQKSLFLVGHPSDGSAVQDDELRMSFLPTVGSVARPPDQAQLNQPRLDYLSDGELDRIDKEREKELYKRRKRNTRGRRGVALPDREPLKTQRTPAIGFPEIDPQTLALAAAAAAPTSRRAAAAAASLTIANMVASENGTAVIAPVAPLLPQTPSIPTSKVPKAKGSFKAPAYRQELLKPRANLNGPTPSTAADTSTFEPPLEGDAPLPPSSVATAAPDSKAQKVMTAKRQRELEKEAKEREYADGQRANMIDGVWHCSNCGCPENVAIGRRKGPLGDKTQCGACGKFWHRHRRPRPVEYNSSEEYHLGLKMEAERAKASAKKRGGAAALRALNLAKQEADQAATPASLTDQESSPTLPKSEAWAKLKSPRKGRASSPDGMDLDRPLSPASSVTSSASERPLAHTVQVNGSGHKATAPSSTRNTSESPAPTAEPMTREVSRSSVTSGQTPGPAGSSSLQTISRPEWLEVAAAEMKEKYPDDKFECVLRRGAGGTSQEWRIKCLDCPGKLYTPGAGETLSNFEVHLRNRQHRSRVAARVNGNS